MSSCSRRLTIRVSELEDTILDGACDALNGMEKSQLVQEAVAAEASRLGIRWSVERPPPLAKAWAYMPERGSGEVTATGLRVTVSISLPLGELVKRAAEHVRTTEAQFVLGATLAYIGRLQRCFEGTVAETPEDGEKIKSALQQLKLPLQYQYRGRRAR